MIFSIEHQPLSGFIKDGYNGESLIGANVYIIDSVIGTSSDQEGYFILFDIPNHTFTLRITYLGYEVNDSIIEPDQIAGSAIEIELIPSSLNLSRINVTAEKLDQQVNFHQSKISIKSLQLKNVPQIGEADLFRTLQSLPGILTESEFSTGLIIRGGNSDQNLIEGF